ASSAHQVPYGVGGGEAEFAGEQVWGPADSGEGLQAAAGAGGVDHAGVGAAFAAAFEVEPPGFAGGGAAAVVLAVGGFGAVSLRGAGWGLGLVLGAAHRGTPSRCRCQDARGHWGHLLTEKRSPGRAGAAVAVRPAPEGDG